MWDCSGRRESGRLCHRILGDSDDSVCENIFWIFLVLITEIVYVYFLLITVMTQRIALRSNQTQ